MKRKVVEFTEFLVCAHQKNGARRNFRLRTLIMKSTLLPAQGSAISFTERNKNCTALYVDLGHFDAINKKTVECEGRTVN